MSKHSTTANGNTSISPSLVNEFEILIDKLKPSQLQGRRSGLDYAGNHEIYDIVHNQKADVQDQLFPAGNAKVRQTWGSTYSSGGIIEPDAIESVSQATFSSNAFTAHPYKNLAVSN